MPDNKTFWSAVVATGMAALLLGGCGEHGKAASAAPASGLLLSPEDLITLKRQTLASGPSITGSVLPEKRADLRAEIPAVVLAVLKENGDPVKRGDLLVRLDDTAIRDTLASAETAAQTASQSFEQAQRQYERMVRLRTDNLVSTQQTEDAEIRRNTAQSDRDSARSNLVAARQQLQRTMVRAPFDGIVSDRRVSAGDTAQVGKELLKVMDPGSLRFEGYVSADSVGSLGAGQAVSFRIHGYENREFRGEIMRVNPAANATTRQVEVLVSFARGQEQPGVAGLYAEGRIETRQTAGLAIPAESVVRDGDDAFAWCVREGKLRKVKLSLGARDRRTGDFEIREGLGEGDVLIRYPNSALHDGQSAQLPG